MNVSILPGMRWPLRLGVVLALSHAVPPIAYGAERGYAFNDGGLHAARGAEHELRDHEFREREYRDPRFFDSRFHHDHYYPPLGFVFGALPPGYSRIYDPDGDLFFAGGVWYRESGPGRYLVVAPPIGIAVPVLPPDYTTVMVQGVPYYYANNTYYLQSPSGYLVTEPPSSDVIELPPGSPTTSQPAPGSPIELPPG